MVRVPVSGVEVPVPPPLGFELLLAPPPQPTRARVRRSESARIAVKVVARDFRVSPRPPIKRKPKAKGNVSRARVPPLRAELFAGMVTVRTVVPLLVSEVGLSAQVTPVSDAATEQVRLMVPVNPFCAVKVMFWVPVVEVAMRVSVI